MKAVKTLLMTMSFLLVAVSALASTLTVRADNWPPYNGDPTAAKPGYMIEVLKEIFEPQGITIDYQLMPWTRALHDVNTGKFDAVVGTDAEESPEMILPEENFGLLSNAMYIRKNTAWRYKGVSSLEGMRLGVIDGYSYGPVVDAYIEQNRNSGKVFVVNGDDALPKLIKMLQAGRIDVVVEDANVMMYTLGSLSATNIVAAGDLSDERMYLQLGLTPNKETSRKYEKMFNEGIAKLCASGRLQQILGSYGVQDWK